MTPVPPPSSPAALPEPTGLYLRLWRAGFRWLYVLDAVGILAVTVLVTVVRFGTDWPEPGELVVGMVALAAILQVVFYFGGLYEKQARLGHRMWFARVVGLTLVGLAVGLVVVLPTGRYAVPRANLAAVGLGVVLVVTATRELSRRLRSRRFGPPRVLLVGSSEQTALAASHLSETDRMAEVAAEVPVDAGVVAAAEAHGATDVVFVDDVSLGDVMPEPLGALDGSGRGVYLRVTATTALLGLRDVREIGGMPYVAIRSRALHPHQLRLKRLVELGVLVVAAPLVVPLLVVAAVYVRLMAGGGVLFRQVRTGRDGVPFTLAKFRTMHHDAEADGCAVGCVAPASTSCRRSGTWCAGRCPSSVPGRSARSSSQSSRRPSPATGGAMRSLPGSRAWPRCGPGTTPTRPTSWATTSST